MQTTILSSSIYDNSSNVEQISPRVLQSRNFSSKSSENVVCRCCDADVRVDSLGTGVGDADVVIFKSKFDNW